jgi:RNase P/RNase MRP subunit POP5
MLDVPVEELAREGVAVVAKILLNTLCMRIVRGRVSAVLVTQRGKILEVAIALGQLERIVQMPVTTCPTGSVGTVRGDGADH